MKKRIGVSVAMLLVVGLPALMLTALAPTGTLSASAQQRAQTAAAHQAFVKFMSSHAPMIRSTVPPAVLSSSSGVAQEFSYNWSGFADVPTAPGNQTPPPVNSVSGSWTIPSVSCISGQYRNQDVFLAQWVGLDGFNDSTVEQLGTATQCYEDVEYYYDWYEMYPNNTVEEGTPACISSNVDCPNPGDRIQASVTSTETGGTNNYTLSLTDATNPAESFSVTATCPASTCLNASAEWIVERPATVIGTGANAIIQILPQASYGETAFTSATVPSGHGTPPFGNGNSNSNSSSNSSNGSSSNSNSHGVGNDSFTAYDLPMIDDTATYILSCPGQFGPPGQLLSVPYPATSTSKAIPNGCPPVQFNGGFSDTWDSSF